MFLSIRNPFYRVNSLYPNYIMNLYIVSTYTLTYHYIFEVIKISFLLILLVKYEEIIFIYFLLFGLNLIILFEWLLISMYVLALHLIHVRIRVPSLTEIWKLVFFFCPRYNDNINYKTVTRSPSYCTIYQMVHLRIYSKSSFCALNLEMVLINWYPRLKGGIIFSF